MADVEIKYKGASIATLNETGTKTLKTSAKYCEDDISVSYTKSAVPAETNHRHYEYDNPADVSGAGNYITVVSGDETLKRVRSLDTLLVVCRMPGTVSCVKSCLGTHAPNTYPIYNNAIRCQSVIRHNAEGAANTNDTVNAVDDDTNLTAGSGRIYITPEGDLRIYGNTASYPILAGKVIVEVMW